ncbi:MAG: hypothetical protein L3K04_04270 [Thermoplasmata archaeon]|nr:hypothetical protein [Thermoplasmata archaeon]
MTRDPALYAELVGMLREFRIPIVSLLPGERIPERVAAVLTSAAESSSIDHPLVLGVEPGAERASLFATVQIATFAREGSQELFVGIDSGPAPGYAVLAGETAIAEGSMPRPEAVASFAAQLHGRFPSRSFRYRVGMGDRLFRTRIVNALWEVTHSIEVVDERGTTTGGSRGHRDAAAARRIAKIPGRAVRGPVGLEIRPGEIANLQRLSRISSGGTHTIPRSLAVRVLEGSLTLADAVEASRPSARFARGHASA